MCSDLHVEWRRASGRWHESCENAGGSNEGESPSTIAVKQDHDVTCRRAQLLFAPWLYGAEPSPSAGMSPTSGPPHEPLATRWLLSSDARSFGLLVVVTWLLAAAMTAVDRPAFLPYFGNLHPLLAVAIVAGVGAVAMARLARADVAFVGARRFDLGRAAIMAVLFAVPTIAVDAAMVPFSADINVHLPAALLFYPVMAVVVELTFHAAPLALLWPVVERAHPGAESRSRRLWTCIALVAVLEPAFQIMLAGPLPTWLTAYLAVHLFAFSLVELWLFIHRDFMTMLCFRLTYYLCWHILWGHVRLGVLF